MITDSSAIETVRQLWSEIIFSGEMESDLANYIMTHGTDIINDPQADDKIRSLALKLISEEDKGGDRFKTFSDILIKILNRSIDCNLKALQSKIEQAENENDNDALVKFLTEKQNRISTRQNVKNTVMEAIQENR